MSLENHTEVIHFVGDGLWLSMLKWTQKQANLSHKYSMWPKITWWSWKSHWKSLFDQFILSKIWTPNFRMFKLKKKNITNSEELKFPNANISFNPSKFPTAYKTGTTWTSRHFYLASKAIMDFIEKNSTVDYFTLEYQICSLAAWLWNFFFRFFFYFGSRTSNVHFTWCKLKLVLYLV